MPQKAKGDGVGQGGGIGLERERQGGNTEAYNTGEEKADVFFWCDHAPRGRKEAGTMLSAVKGVASPWFTGAGSDLLVVK
jgi:hypothetical protein